MKADFFEDRADADHAAKKVKHPERIQKQEERDQDLIGRLKGQKVRGYIVAGDIKTNIDHLDRDDEKGDKDEHQKDFKKEDIKMAHDPFGHFVVPITDFHHEISESHSSLLSSMP